MNSSNPTADPVHAADVHASVARSLVDAWRDRTHIEAPSRTIAGFSRTDALAIAERVRALRVAAGAEPIGYKVGFTNAAVRSQFHADAQLAAPIYAQTLMSERRVAVEPQLGPRIEPEIVVGIGPSGEIAWAALGFEIVQSHIADWNFGYLDAIVDFGLHAALVVGERRPIAAADERALTAIAVRLLRDGEPVEYGAAADVEGGAPGSLRSLRSDLQRTGRDLQPGDIVSTGSMTRVPPIAPGERWTLEALGAELPALTIEIYAAPPR